jgi:hypothetical protein
MSRLSIKCESLDDSQPCRSPRPVTRIAFVFIKLLCESRQRIPMDSFLLYCTLLILGRYCQQIPSKRRHTSARQRPITKDWSLNASPAYGLESVQRRSTGWTARARVPMWQVFVFSHRVQTNSGVYSASYLMGTGDKADGAWGWSLTCICYRGQEWRSCTFTAQLIRYRDDFSF